MKYGYSRSLDRGSRSSIRTLTIRDKRTTARCVEGPAAPATEPLSVSPAASLCQIASFFAHATRSFSGTLEYHEDELHRQHADRAGQQQKTECSQPVPPSAAESRHHLDSWVELGGRAGGLRFAGKGVDDCLHRVASDVEKRWVSTICIAPWSRARSRRAPKPGAPSAACTDASSRSPRHPRTARTRPSARYGNLAGMRQWIEAIYDTCKDQLNLEGHGGRTPAAVIIRVAHHPLALATIIWHNRKINTPRQAVTDRLRPLSQIRNLSSPMLLHATWCAQSASAR